MRCTKKLSSGRPIEWGEGEGAQQNISPKIIFLLFWSTCRAGGGRGEGGADRHFSFQNTIFTLISIQPPPNLAASPTQNSTSPLLIFPGG